LLHPKICQQLNTNGILPEYCTQRTQVDACVLLTRSRQDTTRGYNRAEPSITTRFHSRRRTAITDCTGHRSAIPRNRLPVPHRAAANFRKWAKCRNALQRLNDCGRDGNRSAGANRGNEETRKSKRPATYTSSPNN
jgi:hypothetical protein